MAVESRLIVGQRVSQACNDKEQLVPSVEAIVAVAGPVETVLADSGFYSQEAVAVIEGRKGAEGSTGITVFTAMEKTGHHRSVADLEKRDDPPAPEAGASPGEVMRHRLKTAAGKAKYKLRQQTVEPVFGIIKSVLGFRQFLLRGLQKVSLEWELVSLAYNCKRLHRLGAGLKLGQAG